jgi:hypothetical protein
MGGAGMTTIDLNLDGDNAWPDLALRDDLIHITGSIGMTALDGGMSSGRASVAMRIDLPDGRPVVVETSLRVLVAACRAMLARYPDPDPGVGVDPT